jgi:2'-5' RNA ligase
MAAPGPTPERSARYFIALRPSGRARQTLARLAASLARQFGGRPIGEPDLHLTLAFVGAAPPDVEPALRQSIASLPNPGTMTLSDLGTFGPRLLWIGPETRIPWLEAMADALRNELGRVGVGFDARRFSAHVTLVRGARPIAASDLAATHAQLTPIPSGAMRVAVGSSAPAASRNRYRWLK